MPCTFGVRPVASLDGQDLPSSPLVAAIARQVSRMPT